MGEERERFPWQGAPGWSGVDPGQHPPHAPMPGAPPYPARTAPEPAGPAAPAGAGPVLARCIAAPAGWVAVALLIAAVTGVASWPLRGLALALPWLVGSAVLVFPARRGAGPGMLVALAFGPFWLLHALAVGLLGW
ncbi:MULTISPECIES: hypothetical protein [Pseudonocardia]|uniref:Uncharacterized protein n=2 Tax=Pseudonocardia TaxID=1847 RepID=A0A1Y2N0F1_PSEAH|nr:MULTISPECIES: hypothetical protein [Pseudonocardia]OSY40378.1 hypothetical protein BG845_02782 [Pseudonocardia autotrophica]TDN72291.1 hypothetical protein C8E95_1347 [Pseudonocardia autotrophica]BBG03003.1 hypothetical protein Pdca_42120 [Pseudonocardia autotrophica]GEC25095.1 hypothetical protein PSA01_21240 [Pseudonocardia saturnea]